MTPRRHYNQSARSLHEVTATSHAGDLPRIVFDFNALLKRGTTFNGKSD